MKLKNKKTGEIKTVYMIDMYCDNIYLKIENGNVDKTIAYNSLAKLCEEWEDYKEPKEFYYIDEHGNVCCKQLALVDNTATKKEIGNYFETKEEAEEAVRKLQAWKRLKDAGFDVSNYGYDYDTNLKIDGEIYFSVKSYDGIENDFKLLFRGEE